MNELAYSILDRITTTLFLRGCESGYLLFCLHFRTTHTIEKMKIAKKLPTVPTRMMTTLSAMSSSPNPSANPSAEWLAVGKKIQTNFILIKRDKKQSCGRNILNKRDKKTVLWKKYFQVKCLVNNLPGTTVSHAEEWLIPMEFPARHVYQPASSYVTFSIVKCSESVLLMPDVCKRNLVL